MTVKIMTGKQVNFLKKLLEKKATPPAEWAAICQSFQIEKEEDLYHLNVEEASRIIGVLLKMPDK